MKPKFPQELADKLEVLKDVDEWEAFADLSLKCIEKWRAQLSIFSLENDSIEKIAKQRIRWTAMISGVETLFLQMDELVQENKKRRDDDDGDE